MSVWSAFLWTPQFLTGSFVSGLLGTGISFFGTRASDRRRFAHEDSLVLRAARETKIQTWNDGINRSIRAEAAGRVAPGMASPGAMAAMGLDQQLEDTLTLRENWFRSLRAAMREEARNEADNLRRQPPAERRPGMLAKLLADEVNRLEREWNLI
jgi:hypothetical protein